MTERASIAAGPAATAGRTRAWRLVVGLMLLAAALGNAGRLALAGAAPLGPIGLERAIPDQFGSWRREVRLVAPLVDPQTRALTDAVYGETLARAYVDAAGHRVMLSIAYAADQRGALRAHQPETCYPAQGFALHAARAGRLETAVGAIPVRRLDTSRGWRIEPVTYWLTVAGRPAHSAIEQRIAELRALLAGRLPDGVLVRVSSIDPDATVAYRLHDDFIGQLLAAVSPADRARLAGVAGS